MPGVLAALASGLLFGLGLTISQMINPAKIIGFLDLSGPWDPSLALVIIAAVPVAAVGYALARRRPAPFFASVFAAPTQTQIDRRLIIGATLFGIGWGLVGYCPGPAIASLAVGSGRTVLFVVSMLIGMAAYSAVLPLPSGRTKRV